MLEPLPVVEMMPNICPRDGTPLGDEMKAGKMRRVCPTCGYIYGRDPRVVVSLLISQQDEILFIAREDSWSLPLYRYDEQVDPRALAARLFREETSLVSHPGELINTFSVNTEM